MRALSYVRFDNKLDTCVRINVHCKVWDHVSSFSKTPLQCMGSLVERGVSLPTSFERRGVHPTFAPCEWATHLARPRDRVDHPCTTHTLGTPPSVASHSQHPAHSGPTTSRPTSTERVCDPWSRLIQQKNFISCRACGSNSGLSLRVFG